MPDYMNRKKGIDQFLKIQLKASVNLTWLAIFSRSILRLLPWSVIAVVRIC